MGHSGSVHRPRAEPRRAQSSSALYGEPVGSRAAANAANSRSQYTPAQLQALYLSRGRPDMAFMTNQSSMAPQEVPEMQQTCTVKNHVNLKKSTLKLTPTADDPNKVSLQFSYDATKAGRGHVYLVAIEAIDDDTGCSSYALAHPDHEIISWEFGEGLAQTFSLAELNNASVEPFFDLAKFSASELSYDEAIGSLRFPLVIVLEVADTGKAGPQSQSTFATFVTKPSGEWAVKVLKQKIQVDDMTYELQEIYGIDGSVASTAQAKHDGEPGTNRDEVEMPDGAECIICMSEPRNTTVLPCRHMCLCGDCAEMLRKNSSTCPICRTRVEALLQIRVDAKKDEDDDEAQDEKEAK